jgi:hypothetical protein
VLLRYLLQNALIAMPDLALAIVGVVLFKRERSLATALVALGFGVVTASHVLGTLLGLDWADALAIIRLHGWVLKFNYWTVIASRWVAVGGLLWHTLQVNTASPNNRWRGP